MLLGLAKKTGLLISKLRSFGEFFESTFRGKVIFVVIGLAFFALSSIIFTLFGAVMINFPKTWATFIISCFCIPTIVLFSVPFMKPASNNSGKHLAGTNAEIRIGVALIAGLGLCASGLIGAFSGSDWMPKSVKNRILPDNSRFPLNDVSGFDVDKEGRIYIAIQDYSRIQVYDKSGKFLNGWPVPSGYGIFRIWLKNNQLNVVTSRTEKHLVYDNKGKLFEGCRLRLFKRVQGCT